jgi:hypothetical protein
MVLSNITYDDGTNGTRPLFYRLSVAEMVVPVSPLVPRRMLRRPHANAVCYPALLVRQDDIPAPPKARL